MSRSVDQRITAHYDGGDLLSAIERGVEQLGKTPTTVTIDDLGPVDEFHVGGRPATIELCDQLGVNAGGRVLDIGCGIGGAARFIAATYGCSVTGIDLTPNYIDAARTLTSWTGHDTLVDFEVGSAVNMPFADERFDHAVQLHVGMNISDKKALFGEVHRVLKPGGRFGVYDIMRLTDAPISYPVPWATDASTSFVETVDTYRNALEAAGFVVTAERNRREFAVEFFTAMKARVAEAGGPPPLGLHVIIGAETPTKVSNMVGAFGSGVLAPVELVCAKPA